MPKKFRRSKSNNDTLLIAAVVGLFACVCLLSAGIAGAYFTGMFNAAEAPLPTAAVLPTAAPVTRAAATPTRAATTAAAATPTVAPILETIAKVKDPLEGLALGQERNGSIHLAYSVLTDQHPIYMYRRTASNKWEGGLSEPNTYTPLFANNPANGQLCMFWLVETGLRKKCYANNAWASVENISNDRFASNPVFAPDGSSYYLSGANNTTFKGITLDLPNTQTLEKLLGVDTTGRIHVVMRNNKEEIIHRFSEDQGTTWSNPTVISNKTNAPNDKFAVAMAADGQGRMHLLLTTSSRVWSKDKGWSAPSALKAPADLGVATLTIDSKGTLHALVGTQYMRQNAEGAWSEPIPFSKEANILISPSTAPQMVVGADGVRHFAWALTDGTIKYATLP